MPAAAMSIGRCGASCAASTTSRAPYRCAIAASRSSGQTSPVTLDAPVSATMPKRRRAPRNACSHGLAQRVGRRREREQLQVVAPPGEHVGVVLDGAPEDPRARGQRRRQHVDRLRRVAHQDDVVVARGADEGAHVVAGTLERLRRDLRLGAAAAVHAAVPRHEGGHGVPHLGQRGRARRVVEVGVPARAAVGAHDVDVGAEQAHVRTRGRGAGVDGHHARDDRASRPDRIRPIGRNRRPRRTTKGATRAPSGTGSLSLGLRSWCPPSRRRRAASRSTARSSAVYSNSSSAPNSASSTFLRRSSLTASASAGADDAEQRAACRGRRASLASWAPRAGRPRRRGRTPRPT